MAKGPAGIRAVMRAVDKNIHSAIQAGISSTYYSAAEIAQVGADRARELVDHPGTNRPYIDKKGRPRVSSHPGEPPASGPEYDLYNTIFSSSVTKKNQNPARAIFGATAPYSANLEFGVPGVAPRPFMRPARDAAKILSSRIVSSKWNAAVKRKIRSMPKLPPIFIELG